MVGEPWEFDWTLRGGGPAVLFPDKWADFIGFLPEHGRSTPMRAYHEMLTSDDKEVVRSAARSWNAWELSISTLTLADDAYAKLEDETWSLQHARIEAHYFMNDCFLKDERALLKPQNIEKIRHIPCKCLTPQLNRSGSNKQAVYMVQGRYDVVCPPKAAWMLHQAMPESKLYWSPDAGHSALVCISCVWNCCKVLTCQGTRNEDEVDPTVRRPREVNVLPSCGTNEGDVSERTILEDGVGSAFASF